MNTSYNYADFIGLNLDATIEPKDSDYKMKSTIHPDKENSIDNISKRSMGSAKKKLVTTCLSS